jgi:hypothetical protein
MSITIDQLEKLEKAATPGPWTIGRGVVINGAEYGGLNISRTATMGDKGDDLELIAAARNALPALLAVAKAAAVIAENTGGSDVAYVDDNVVSDDELASLRAALAQLKDTK